jgi:osmotically-inducible protein OsmY
MPSPEAICQQRRAALEHEPRINLHRYPIHLHCEDGIVTVDGDAEHIVAKKLALERAAAIPGVDSLVDRLRVVPTRPMGDGAVRDHVRDVLLQIRICTQGRVVTLEGLVPHAPIREMAEFDVWSVFGIDRVVNQLQVHASRARPVPCH